MPKRPPPNEPPRSTKPRSYASHRPDEVSSRPARAADAMSGVTSGVTRASRENASAKDDVRRDQHPRDKHPRDQRGPRGAATGAGATAPASQGRPARREAPSREPRGGAARHGDPARGGASTPIYGFHAVRAALAAGRRRLHALFATEAASAKLAPEIAAAGLAPRITSAEELTRRLGANAVHQGVMLEAEPIAPIDLSEIVDRSGIVLVLDQITDPHNVGAILRTAAAFGVDALVTTTRHAPDFSGVVAKAASGGLDHVPIADVTNLARALETLGEMGYFRVGLDSEGAETLEHAPLVGPVALVLGAEDKGLRRLTRERCDVVARLDMPGPIKSLNVSNACAVALALTLQRLADKPRG